MAPTQPLSIHEKFSKAYDWHLSAGRWMFLAVAVTFVGVGCDSSPRKPVNDRTVERTTTMVATLPIDTDEKSVAPREAKPDDWFDDVTNQTGIQFRYQNGQEAGHFTLLESVGGGVAMFDYDQDGDLDLFFTGGGAFTATDPVRIVGKAGGLFRNEGAWRFTDVTKQSGLDIAGDYSHGCDVADFDRDGWPDLFVSCYGQCQLFHNERNGQFREISRSAGIVTKDWHTAVAWGDVDGDGWPDLYVAAYVKWTLDPNEYCGNREHGERDVCLPSSYPPAQHRLFLNQRDGTFQDITKRAGINDRGRGLGVCAFDFNADGRLDFYVANDAGANQLYQQGSNLAFEDVATVAGCAFNEFGAPEGSMGVAITDYDGNGLPDIFVTNFEYEDNSLYRNDGLGLFNHASVSAGLSGRCRRYVGFGTMFGDFDLDGWEDLVIVNGHVLYRHPPVKQPAVLFKHGPGKRFIDVSDSGGPYFSIPHGGRGVAAGDLDNDGALDLVIVHQNDPVAILRNRMKPKGWFGVELKGQKSNFDAIGAMVTADFPDRKMSRFVAGGGSYLSCSTRKFVFPIEKNAASEGNESFDHDITVTVRWPSGQTEQFARLDRSQYNLLREGTGDHP